MNAFGGQYKGISQTNSIPLPLPPHLTSELNAEKVSTLYEGVNTFLLVTNLCAAMCLALVWQQLSVDIVTAWVGVMTFSGLTLITIKRSCSQSLDFVAESDKYKKYFLICTTSIGLCWAGAAGWIGLTGTSLQQAIIFSVIAGLCIHGAATFATIFTAFLTLAIPSTIAIIVLLATSTASELFPLTAATLIFTGFLGFGALNYSRAVQGALIARFRNKALIQFLEQSKTDADKLNTNLTKEVHRRVAADKSLKITRDKLASVVKDHAHSLEETHSQLNNEIQQHQQTAEALKENKEQLSLAIGASKLGLWDWDLENKHIYHSRYNELFGYTEQEMEQFEGLLTPLIHKEDRQRARDILTSHLKGQSDQYIVDYRLKHRSGEWRWFEDKGRAVSWNADNKVTRMVGTRRDITAQKNLEERLQLAATVFDSTSEAVFVLDHKFRFMTTNDAFVKVTGYEREDVLDKEFFAISSTDNTNTYAEILQNLQDNGCWQGELLEQRKSGDSFPQWLQINAVYDKQELVSHYVGLVSDLTARKDAEEKLKYLANYDKITGLANRSLFNDRLHLAINTARQSDENLALILVDLDRFKNINETLGFETGDQVLMEVSQRLSAVALEADTIARLDSDQFTVLFDNYCDMKVLDNIAEQIIYALNKPFQVNNREVFINASIGISLFPENGKEMQMLLNKADTAAHHAKHLGGNSYQFYTEELQNVSVERLNLETGLRKAIQNNEFEVYYQPKMDLSSGLITAAEALVRWRHPELGLVSPAEFIPLAEETGLISAIGEFVMQSACHQAFSWYKQGLGEIIMSVNISAQQMRKGNLYEVISRTLHDSQLPAHLLGLELTESLLVENIEETIDMLDEIRALGIEISIDDFGTGYSSLSYLKRFPIDILKIDQAFIRDLENSSDDAAITRAIIAMAHSLDLKVIAEGVEKEEHLAFLQKEKCDMVQGYLISKPLPAEEITPLLQQNHIVAVG